MVYHLYARIMAQPLAAFLALLSGFLSLPQAAQAQAPSLIAAAQNSAPKYFPPDAGQRGVCGDIYLALQNRLARSGIALVIDTEPLPIKRILHNLDTGKMHLFCGAGRNAKREKRFHYSETPVWHTSNVVMTASTNPVQALSFTKMARDKTIIGAFFGTSSARFLMQQPGIRVDDSYKSLEAALRDVSRGHLAYFYYHDLGLNWLLRKNPHLPARIVGTKFRTVPQWMLYSRSLPAPLRLHVDKQVTELATSGAIDAIMARYRPAGF